MDTRRVEADPQLARLLAEQQAPLRIFQRFEFATSPQRLFALLGDLEGITRFFPMIHHAAVEHPNGCAAEGSNRVCSIRGMGDVHERIVWYRPPAGYAYRAQGRMVPLRDHLGVIQISDHADDGALLEWRQYFNTRYGPMGWAFPTMMQWMMRRAMSNVGTLLDCAVVALPAAR